MGYFRLVFHDPMVGGNQFSDYFFEKGIVEVKNLYYTLKETHAVSLVYEDFITKPEPFEKEDFFFTFVDAETLDASKPLIYYCENLQDLALEQDLSLEDMLTPPSSPTKNPLLRNCLC